MGRDVIYGMPAGGYDGEDFKSGMPEVSIVKGKFLGVKTDFIFNSARINRNTPELPIMFFYEQLTIHSEDGELFATALYRDGGVGGTATGILSGATDADYKIVAANGCYDELEGAMINIKFDNERKGKPRTIELKKGKGDRCKDEEKKEEGTSMKVFKWLIDRLLK
jgi:hypothetical protein